MGDASGLKLRGNSLNSLLLPRIKGLSLVLQLLMTALSFEVIVMLSIIGYVSNWVWVVLKLCKSSF